MAKSRKPIKKPFRFRDLPIEIQLKIFQLFMPAEAPAPVAENYIEGIDDAEEKESVPVDFRASATRIMCQRLVKGSNSVQRTPAPSSIKQALPNYANSKDAFSLIQLDQSTFTDFAPHYYQYQNFVFRDPARFANEFLANASNACLYNLRYDSCIVDDGGNERWSPPSSNLTFFKKLSELIAVWTEL